MGVDRLADLAVVLPGRHRQEGQGQRHQGRILLRVVKVAEHRPFERADLEPVEIFARFRERRAVIDLERPVASGLLGQQGGKLLDAGGESALLAPDRIIPGQFRAVDLGGLRRRRDGRCAERHGRCRAGDSKHDAAGAIGHEFPPSRVGGRHPGRIPDPSLLSSFGRLTGLGQPSCFPEPAASAAPSS